jgi:putative heme-binding domain-containing protein
VKAALTIIVLAWIYAMQDQMTEADLAKGRQLFISQCALCHGIEGAGGRGPALNHSSMRRATDDAALFSVIKFGIEGTEMPDFWPLSDREIRQVAHYVRSLSRAEAEKLTGDPAKGREVFAAKGCAACHIVRGQGGNSGPELTEIGARRSAAYLREALLDPGASVPDGYLIVTATTRDDRQARGVRLSEDTFTIQLRDAAGIFHSFRKAELKELKKEFGLSAMPNYKEKLTAAELDHLTAYLVSLRGVK